MNLSKNRSSMKAIIYLFTLSILFQSCYGYKDFSQSSKELEIGQLYKFDLTNKKEFRILIDSLDQNYVYGQVGEKNSKFPHSEIKTIEVAKKSPGRTVGLITIIASGVAAVVGLAIFFSSLTDGYRE